MTLSWWFHQMETFSALLAICEGNSPVPGEFPTQRQVTRSFDVFFDLYPNKRLSKQWWGWWFEMTSCPLWRHCNAFPWCDLEMHNSDVIMSATASQITSLTIAYWTVCSGADQKKHQSSASLAFVEGIHRWRWKKVPMWWRHHAIQFRAKQRMTLNHFLLCLNLMEWSKGIWFTCQLHLNICSFMPSTEYDYMLIHK